MAVAVDSPGRNVARDWARSEPFLMRKCVPKYTALTWPTC